MTTYMPSELATLASPDWLLAGIDTAHDRFQFARVSRQTYRQSVFLDHRIQPRPEELRSVSGEEVDRVLAESDPPPAGWIFHTAFCCSTLLAQCLDDEDATRVLREPAALSRLAAEVRAPVDTAGEALRRRVLRLVERTYGDESVLVKPSNYANALLHEVLVSGPGATGPRRCVLLSSGLNELLLSLLKKRAEAEQLLASFTEALMIDSDYAERVDLPSLDGLPLLRQGVVFWHCQRHHFQRVRAQAREQDVLGLTMEGFLAEPAATLARVGEFFALGLEEEALQRIVEEGAFRRHAKAGGEYGPEQRRHEAAALEVRHGDELAAALEWAGELLKRVPVEPLVPGEDPLGD